MARMTTSVASDVQLLGPGMLRFEVADAFFDSHCLLVDLVPTVGGVRLATREATAIEWRSVVGTLSAEEFTRFAARLTAALATPPEDGSYDCGTHGEWVMAAEVTLPLSSGTVEARATETAGFASLPVLEVVREALARLAALPGSVSVSAQSAGVPSAQSDGPAATEGA
jgi:hypothetical protein